MVKRGKTIDLSQKSKMSSKEVQEILIENFVGLQKAMTNLSIKFESLSSQITRLLEIFELSAKNFMKDGQDREIMGKIDALLEQNKTIAKGLVMIEEKSRSFQQYPSQPQQQQYHSFPQQENLVKKPKPLPTI